MSDIELSELVEKFQAIQRQGVPNQIGERNVVEIINVIREKKLVDLLYTVDGKEYLTWDQLRREVVDEVVVNGGRMNVVDLPGSLNVHVTYIERVLPEVLEDPTIRLESGEIMTDEYLDSTVQAAAGMLKEQGFLSIADFAKTNKFSSFFAQKLLMSAVESGRLRAVTEGNAIYTTQFVHSQKIVLRAGLMAATRPVNLTAFFKRHGLFLPLVDSVMCKLSAELPGKVEGGVYVPTCFEVSRAEQVESVYLSNGFIDYVFLHRQGISQAKEFLISKYNPVLEKNITNSTSTTTTKKATTTGTDTWKRRGRRTQNADSTVEVPLVTRTESHPNAGHALSNCFVSDRFLDNLVVLEDLVHGDTLALDLVPHLPPSVNVSKDFGMLLKRLSKLHPIIDSCIVLDGGVLIHESALEKVKVLLRGALEESLKERVKRKGKKKTESVEFGESQQEIFMNVLSNVTGLSLDEYPQALEELSSQWNEVARNIYQELIAAMEQHASVDLRRMRSRFQESLRSAWADLFVVSRGVMWCTSELDEAASVAINRNVLSLRALPMVRDIIINESLDAADTFERVSDIVNPEQLSTVILQRALRALPEKQWKPLLPLIEAANGKCVENFTNLLRELCTTGEIAVSSFHQPNKKQERETLVALKKGVAERVESDSFSLDAVHSGALFASICSLLLHTHFHIHVDLPGRAVGSVVKRLVKEGGVATGGLLQDCHQCITDAIGGKELSPESLAKLEEFRKMSLEGT